MPTYGYRCSSCGHEFERFQKITDEPLTECESCSGPVKKLLYPVGIQFKGSGFYVNDYARKSGSDGGSTSSKSDSGDTATKAPATPSTESTPAAAAPVTPASTNSSSSS